MSSQTNLFLYLYLLLLCVAEATPYLHKRIIGGSNAAQGEFPFVAYFQSPIAPGEVAVCGGSLISANYILTAAHCCVNAVTGQPEGVAVRTGSDVWIGGYSLAAMRQGQGPPNGGEHHTVAQTNIPSSHKLGTNVDDICVVRLSTSASSQAARVRMNFDADTPQLPGSVTAIGWGTTNPNTTQQPDILQQVLIPLVSGSECNQLYGGDITSSMICAGDLVNGGKDTCQGDSGGPLLSPSGSGTILVGLTSFGAGCGDKSFPGVYTRVSSFKSYICSQTGSEPYDCPGGTDTGGGATLATPSAAASRIPNVLSLLLGSK